MTILEKRPESILNEHRHVLVPCCNCGQERWVMLYRGQPRYSLCKTCNGKKNGLIDRRYNFPSNKYRQCPFKKALLPVNTAGIETNGKGVVCNVAVAVVRICLNCHLEYCAFG